MIAIAMIILFIAGCYFKGKAINAKGQNKAKNTRAREAAKRKRMANLRY